VVRMYLRKENKKEKNTAIPCGVCVCVEPMVGIEPTTCSLRVSCSTSEPHRLIMTFLFYYLNCIQSTRSKRQMKLDD
jgi:hypothetical protein